MTRRWAHALSALSVVALAACEQDIADQVGVEGTDAFDRYASIGTSISMGYQSSGVYYAGQTNSFPSLLADQAFAAFTNPLIQAPGCPPPIIAPLQLGRRLDATSTAASSVCAPNVEGVELPENNVAVEGSTTYQALHVTPEDFPAKVVLGRVLPAGQSQVTAALAQNPTLVSVELGSNEVLRAAVSGILLPGVYDEQTGVILPAPGLPAGAQGTFVPFEVWSPVYEAIVDSVVASGARALLVTVPEVTSIVSLRRGQEIYDNRAALAQFGVVVDANCGTAPGANNLLFVPFKVLPLVQQAAATGQAQALSCADVAFSQDFVLSETEQAQLAAIVGAMNAYIAALATEHGFALLEANEPLGTIKAAEPPFNIVNVLGCPYPYGEFISLDGVHPNIAGHRLAANAAAEALNEAYGFAIPLRTITPRPASELCPPPAA